MMHRRVNPRHRFLTLYMETLRPCLLLGLGLLLVACARPPTAQPLYAVGQTAEVDGWQVTVHGLSIVPGDPWRQPREGHVFCAVELTLKNVSSQIRFVMPERQMQLLDAANHAFALDSEAGIMAARSRQWFVPQGTMEVGQETYGAAAYEVPADSKLRWVFRSGLFPWSKKVVFVLEEAE